METEITNVWGKDVKPYEINNVSHFETELATYDIQKLRLKPVYVIEALKKQGVLKKDVQIEASQIMLDHSKMFTHCYDYYHIGIKNARKTN